MTVSIKRSKTFNLYDYVINNKTEKKRKRGVEVGVEGTGWK
jgi:hypothetical protein